MMFLMEVGCDRQSSIDSVRESIELSSLEIVIASDFQYDLGEYPPAEILLVDPQKRMTGLDNNATNVWKGIPDSDYYKVMSDDERSRYKQILTVNKPCPSLLGLLSVPEDLPGDLIFPVSPLL
jgi:hypothetical protein